MICENCKKEVILKKGILFCRSCGHRLKSVPPEYRGTKRSHKGLVFGSLAVLVGLAVLVVVLIVVPTKYSASALINKYGSCVVSIQTYDDKGEELGYGSGVIVSDDGLILTNNHVIDGASSGIVKIANGGFHPIDAIYDSDNFYDLSTIQIEAKTPSYIEEFNLDRNSPVVGEKIVCIGNPQGLNNSLSEGIVSALRGSEYHKIIQTTAPISHGSSGGGMFDTNGRLVGITTLTHEGGQNLNFAVPVKYALNQIYSYLLLKRLKDNMDHSDVYEYIAIEKDIIQKLQVAYDSGEKHMASLIGRVMNKHSVSRTTAIKRLTKNAEALSEMATLLDAGKSLDNRKTNHDKIVDRYNELYISETEK